MDNQQLTAERAEGMAPFIETVERTEAPAPKAVGVTVLTINGEERPGELIHIGDDLRTAKVRTSPSPQAGEAVVFYIECGMRFVATCQDVTDGVATLRLKLSHHRATRADGSGIRRLREDRIRKPANDACTLRDAHGQTHECRVLDISLTGLFVATEAKLAEGEVVKVGRAAAEVVRRGPTGYGMRLVRAGLRPVEPTTASTRAERFAVGLAPQAAVA